MIQSTKCKIRIGDGPEFEISEPPKVQTRMEVVELPDSLLALNVLKKSILHTTETIVEFTAPFIPQLGPITLTVNGEDIPGFLISYNEDTNKCEFLLFR